MIAERELTIKYAGQWHTVVVLMTGKIYTRLCFTLKHKRSEVIGWYDQVSNQIELPGIEGGIYPLALREYLSKEGIKPVK